MKSKREDRDPVVEWNKISGRIGGAIRGLSEKDLGLRGGSEGWSIRETVHHLVEANLIASNMIIAALATHGGDFDWTWVNPNKSWMHRVGYDQAGVGPALKMLRALSTHISALLAAHPDALKRTVRLNDSPGAPRYDITVEKILWDQVEHVGDHLGDIRDIREKYSR